MESIQFIFIFGSILFVLSSGARLDLSENYMAEWTTTDTSIHFNISVKTSGWVGFGISKNGAMLGADIIIGGVKEDGTFYFEDYIGVGNTRPKRDVIQNYELNSASEFNKTTTLSFSRLLETCDDEDVPITEDTLKIIWSYGVSDEISYHGTNRSVHAVNFLDPDLPPFNKSEYEAWRVTTNMKIPANDTTYWCSFHRGPSITGKHHIVGFDIVFGNAQAQQHVHHADFLKCVAPNGINPEEYFSPHLGPGYDCYFPPEAFPLYDCQLFELQWGKGSQITLFPENVGVPIGENGVEFYMTEIHFDNPNRLTNLEFEAGLEIYYTQKLREFDAGFLQLGTLSTKTFSLTVPPNEDQFVVSSHCPDSCTEHIPQDGVKVFNYMLHSHQSGRRIKLRHFRNSEELVWFGNDETFDFNYQNNRPLSVEKNIYSGDAFVLECTYSTVWKNGGVTIGGRSARDEMCQSMLMYYPRIPDLNLCGDYFPQKEMLELMDIEDVSQTFGVNDPIVESPEHRRGMKYSHVVENLIEWTPMKRQMFQNVTRFGKHVVVCDAQPVKDDFLAEYPLAVEYVPKKGCEPQVGGSSTIFMGKLIYSVALTFIYFTLNYCVVKI